MAHTFRYKFGELELGDQVIRIDDEKHRKSLKWTLWLAPLNILMALTYFYKNGFTGDFFDYIYLLAIMTWCSFFVIDHGLSWEERIELKDIVSIRLRKRLANEFLDIKLRSGKTRRVSGVNEISRGIEHYIEQKFPDDQ